MEKARRKRAARKRVGGPHATTRGPKFTRQRARHLHARAHAHTLFRATYTERKGVVPSLTCRRLEGERTIAGAERTRQLRSMMFPFYLPLSTITSLLCPFPFPPFVFFLYSLRHSFLRDSREFLPLSRLFLATPVFSFIDIASSYSLDVWLVLSVCLAIRLNLEEDDISSPRFHPSEWGFLFEMHFANKSKAYGQCICESQQYYALSHL